MSKSIQKKPEWELRMDRVEKTLEEVGKKLEKTESIVNGNSNSYREIDKTLDRVGKKLDKTASIVSGIGDSNGAVAETFFENATKKGLELSGIHFEQIASNLVVRDKKLHPQAEIDIVMNNCKYLLLIETKYRLDSQHKNAFKKKIKALKTHNPEFVEERTILTAFATLGAKKSIIEAFNEAGHYVFTVENETLRISVPKT